MLDTQTILRTAADLIGPHSNDDHVADEYRRAMVDMVGDLLGLSLSDERELIERLIDNRREE